MSSPARLRPLVPVLVLLSVVLAAGCSRPAQESTPTTNGGPLDARAPSVSVVANHAWERSATGAGALKIVVLSVTAAGPTTMRWQDARLHLAGANLTASSAYVRVPNGTSYTSFGWSAPRTLASNETLVAEFHFQTNGTIEEPTTGSIVGPGWTADFSLPPPK